VKHLLEDLDFSKPDEWKDKIPWKAFHEGVEIHRLYGDGVNGPSAALLRFAPGGRIPFHLHIGYEHIMVLQGSQEDEHGHICAGGLRIHPPGSSHSVASQGGCIVLAIYEKPVSFESESSQGQRPG
jgi:anti-sigma factor ChrR (cupin superfamily)